MTKKNQVKVWYEISNGKPGGNFPLKKTCLPQAGIRIVVDSLRGEISIA